jgi:hypothetical protein
MSASTNKSLVIGSQDGFVTENARSIASENTTPLAQVVLTDRMNLSNADLKLNKNVENASSDLNSSSVGEKACKTQNKFIQDHPVYKIQRCRRKRNTCRNRRCSSQFGSKHRDLDKLLIWLLSKNVRLLMASCHNWDAVMIACARGLHNNTKTNVMTKS